MRFTLIALALTATATATAAQARPALELHWQQFGEDTFVTPEEMQSDDTAFALNDVLDPFAIDQDKSVDSICFKGDVNQVCSLLSKMSKLSGQKYGEGDHGLAALKGCRILGRGKPVQAKIELSDDYSEGTRTVTATIAPCAN